MVLGHILADFVLQPVALSQMKTKNWWVEECERNGIDFKNHNVDYLAALLMHSLSWSILILLPIMYGMHVSDVVLVDLFVVNTAVHCIVDDLKVNRYKVSMWTDQVIHLLQIVVTFAFVVYY